MITPEKVFEIVKRGPSIPNEIRMRLGEGDTYVIGAVLSELVKSGKVKVTNTKKGGTPYYFAVGNEHQLENISGSLNEKDRRTFEKLKFEKVLRDSEQEPLIRVSLRNIKDFSKPIEVNTKEGRIMFFKYFLVPNSEAETLIKQKLGMKKPEENPAQKELINPEVVKKIENKKQEIIPETKKREIRETFNEEKTIEPATAEFEIKVEKFFKRKEIEIIEKEIIRRQSELDYIIKIPSPAGQLNYLCKARNKKKFNDKDLSAAFVEGQEKKLPVLFLITGELTRKAEQMLEDKFRNITVNKI